MSNKKAVDLTEELDFVQVYDIYFDQVNRYLRYRASNTWDADDLTAQVFAKAFENFHKCRHKERVGAWVFQIAHNTYVDYLRQKREHLPLDEQLLQADKLGQPEESAVACEEMEELRQCLHELNQDQRDVLLLRYFGDLKYQQIAQILGKKDATVKTVGFRGMQKLRVLWQEKGGEQAND